MKLFNHGYQFLCVLSTEYSLIIEEFLERVMDPMGLEKMVRIKEDIGAADAVLALCCKLISNLCVRGMAKPRQVTFFAIKTNTSDPNGEGNACNNEHAGNISLDSDHTRGDKGGKLELPIYKRSISAQDIDALEVIKIPSHHQLCRDRQADTCSS